VLKDGNSFDILNVETYEDILKGIEMYKKQSAENNTNDVETL
jgi:hypothetical protein